MAASYNQAMDAGMLECPNCGAAARVDQLSCTHCRVQLQTIACPTCFGMVFSGAQHCSHCGARAFHGRTTAEMPAADGGQSCPRCRATLAVTAIGDAFLEECGGCGGLWVDAESFKKICTRREKSAAYVGLGSPLPAPGHAATLEQVKYLPCPTCSKMMNRLNFARHSGVIVDVCKNHGTWFDKDELRQIVEFIQGGGLEAAHEKDLEKIRSDVARIKSGHNDAQPVVFPEDGHRHESVLEAAGGLLAWFLS